MSTPPLLSGLSILPALSVVLGLPLCSQQSHSNRRPSPSAIDNDVTRSALTVGDGDGIGDNLDGSTQQTATERNPSVTTSSSLSSSSSAAAAATPGRRPRKQTSSTDESLAQRAKNNASRIYARRVINRARLERQHPWNTLGDGQCSSGGAAKGNGNDGQCIDGHGQSKRHDESVKSPTDAATAAAAKQKDKLLSDSLVSLIQLKERIHKIKSLTSSHPNDLLFQFGMQPDVKFPTLQTNPGIAYCETIPPSSKQITLDQYNSLQNSAVVTNDDDKLKPAEWSGDIDLVQRRLEFGREISPLSNTSRLQRWSMALQRMVTLGLLAAPLGAMVPLNVVAGNLLGPPTSEDGAADGGRGAMPRSDTERQQTEQETKPSLLQRYRNTLDKSTWDYALWAIETAGPTYIKLVQWASTRNDLFSPEFVGHFTKLQDETRGHSWRETERTLVRAYGKDWRKVLSFDRMETEEDEEDANDAEKKGRSLERKGNIANRERQQRIMMAENNASGSSSSSSSSSSSPTIPIGSGCVAQVYKAHLRSAHGLHAPGTAVAVKVQHPRILEKVCLDFYILNKLASLLEYIPYLNLDYLSMKDSVDQFRDIMLPQLDLRVEAHNLQRFRRDFDGETRIAFPEPLVGLTSREVLVERFVEGEPMLNFVLKEDEQHSRKDREELATIGLKTVMEMIFLHDFVHADLHPGNMIVDRNKSVRGSPLRVHMIDCGLTVELGESDHMNLVKILGSLIKRNGYEAGQLMVDTAKKCQATELDVELFCRGIEKICVDDEENNFLESVGDYITDICYLACKHKVKLEAAFINAALACEIMEGLASSLYPDMQVQSVALPMVLKAEMMHGLKGLPTPKLWSLR